MEVRVSHTNNSSGHDGTYVYRSTSPMDPQNLPAPIADEPPVALGETFEYIDSPADGTYYYRTQDHEGGQVSAVSDAVPITIGDDYSSVAVGDAIGGGIYAGIRRLNAVDYHYVSAKASGEAVDIAWSTGGSKYGFDSVNDGLLNTQEAVSQGINSFPAAKHCVEYVVDSYDDWYLPAQDELSFISAALSQHAEFSNNISSNDYTWGSNLITATAAHARRLADGSTTSYFSAAADNRARPIRRVQVPIVEVDISSATIGDNVQGGIYAGQMTYGDGRQYHIIAARELGESEILAWGNYGTLTGAGDSDDGLFNSIEVLNNHDDGSAYAFYHARDYSNNGYADWYVPSVNELSFVYSNLIATSHPEFRNDLSEYRWSSTEVDSTKALPIRFSDGVQGSSAYQDKRGKVIVRPVRRVPV